MHRENSKSLSCKNIANLNVCRTAIKLSGAVAESRLKQKAELL
jgi:hypothetical protein